MLPCSRTLYLAKLLPYRILFFIIIIINIDVVNHLGFYGQYIRECGF
jgi:hypothetical protein